MPTLPDGGVEAFYILAEYAPSDPAFRDFYLERIRTGTPAQVVEAFCIVGATELVTGAVASRVEDDLANVPLMLEVLNGAFVGSAAARAQLAMRGGMSDVPTAPDFVLAVMRARGGKEAIADAFDVMSSRVRQDLEYQALLEPERARDLLEILLAERRPMVVLIASTLEPPVPGAEQALKDLLARGEAPEFASTLDRLLGSRIWLNDLGGPAWREGSPDLTRRILREARDPEVREVCIRSIRKGIGAFPDAEELATHALQNDPVYSVRIQAAMLCTDLSPTEELGDILREAAHSDEEGVVRIILQSYLKSNGLWR
jgi:hypothetical protein